MNIFCLLGCYNLFLHEDHSSIFLSHEIPRTIIDYKFVKSVRIDLFERSNFKLLIP